MDDDGRGGLPPRWVDISDEVEEILGRIQPKSVYPAERLIRRLMT
jgi:hypothetical protein